MLGVDVVHMLFPGVIVQAVLSLDQEPKDQHDHGKIMLSIKLKGILSLVI